MGLIRPAFTRTRTDEERAEDESKVIPLRLNKEELAMLEADGKFLEQEKLSTVIKQLMKIGHDAIHDPKTYKLIETVFINKRRNKRLGLEAPEPEFTQM